jgi:nucleotide-binding universal stress UspA family protein
MPMLKRILVATDLSDAGQRAVMRAGQLARQWEASLSVVHAKPDRNLFGRLRAASADGYQDVAQAADSFLCKLLVRLEAEFGVHARRDSRPGRASNVITAMVAEHDPHLVLIGAQGEHSFGDLEPRLGGTALKLLARIERPLLLVKATTAAAYTTSLVAVDCASTLARRATLWPSGMVQDGHCHLVHAYDVPFVERMRDRGINQAVMDARVKPNREEAQTIAQTVSGAAEGSARMQIHVERGEPVATILAAIARYAPQLVVIGRRDVQTSKVPAPPVGSVAFRIAYHAPADVLVLS